MTELKTSDRRHTVSVPFMLLCCLFSVCLILSNLLEIKTIDLGWFTLTAGVIVFPISYIINDCVVEVYGFRKARLMIWTGFAMSLLTVVLLQIGIWLPGGSEWEMQTAMAQIYGAVPRMMLASFAAFLCGSLVNAYVMSKMKSKAHRGSRAMAEKRKSFSLRAVISTLWGESVDSLIFFPIAFIGILEPQTILSLIITQVIVKTLYEVAVLPLTIWLVRRLKRIEHLSNVDTDISYRWWQITDF